MLPRTWPQRYRHRRATLTYHVVVGAPVERLLSCAPVRGVPRESAAYCPFERWRRCFSLGFKYHLDVLVHASIQAVSERLVQNWCTMTPFRIELLSDAAALPDYGTDGACYGHRPFSAYISLQRSPPLHHCKEPHSTPRARNPKQ